MQSGFELLSSHAVERQIYFFISKLCSIISNECEYFSYHIPHQVSENWVQR